MATPIVFRVEATVRGTRFICEHPECGWRGPTPDAAATHAEEAHASRLLRDLIAGDLARVERPL